MASRRGDRQEETSETDHQSVGGGSVWMSQLDRYSEEEEYTNNDSFDNQFSYNNQQR